MSENKKKDFSINRTVREKKTITRVLHQEEFFIFCILRKGFSLFFLNVSCYKNSMFDMFLDSGRYNVKIISYSMKKGYMLSF